MFQGVVNEGVLEADCILLHFCFLLRSERKFKGSGCFPKIKVSHSHPYWHPEIAQMFAVLLSRDRVQSLVLHTVGFITRVLLLP